MKALILLVAVLISICCAQTNQAPMLHGITVPDEVDVALKTSVYAELDVSDDNAVRYVNFGLQFKIGSGGLEGFSVGAVLVRPALPGVDATKRGIWAANITVPPGNASIFIFAGDFDGNDASFMQEDLVRLGFKSFIIISNSSAVIPTPENCGGRRCLGEDGCCPDAVLGPVCFNPTTHKCAGFKRLCWITDNVCGTTCFNPLTHNCFGSTLCGKGDQLCSNPFHKICFNPMFFTCENGNLRPRILFAGLRCGTSICQASELCCANKTCYNPLKASCCQVLDTVNNPQTCDINVQGTALQCCSPLFAGSPISCYDPLLNYCCINSAPGGSSSRLCNANLTTFECCGSRGFRVPV